MGIDRETDRVRVNFQVVMRSQKLVIMVNWISADIYVLFVRLKAVMVRLKIEPIRLLEPPDGTFASTMP